MKTSTSVRELQFRHGTVTPGSRIVPEEVPIAFSFGGSTHAVMMASPADLKDFAVGFCLTEGIIGAREEIDTIEVVAAGDGVDVQIGLVDSSAEALTSRRRQMAGPVGCGLCGIESIEQAVRVVRELPEHGLGLTPADVVDAVHLLGLAQVLNRETRAVHGAGFFVPGTGLVAMREDVGRHNALDKLVGAVLRGGHAGSAGAVVVTSRLSVEMVQKAAMLGSPVLIAISAPTALAIRTAEAANMTLVAIARGEEFEIFTRPERIQAGAVSDVA
ncbi:formate dehydrogenase accessory sulfurtransferase FdhD [Agrobacterium sp. a22-2]|uniref:formate dehydrogenase accessory sulfurtransferase FdhD n=1 Tax=Agrobacterium sp. a22-2 TaxID=2283840 RepID=UPI0014487C79|nr:formate dehydrogenase accessory sulfurtransferase FdhD [Agrobacterium sp. a22-2]NKN37010.1 formate dehydrogenase accessory sulfurtransferase FdhD [Agrobacterium sp. a22-2]